MIAIYKRELKAFFQSMTGWLFVAVTMFITGLYFMAINLLSGYSSVSNTIASSLFIYLITIPILTMRILSEERKQKIDQLILTAPVSIGKIVIGKYMAMCTVLLIPVMVVATYPLILSGFGTISYAEDYTVILGFLLYGMAAIALGLFISSITENQVIAAIVSFGAMFATYMMSAITSLITSTENVVTTTVATILYVFDFSGRFDLLLNGQFDIAAIVYYITMIAMFLFLTTQSIQKRRYSVSTRNLKLGAYSLSMIIVTIVAAVFVNLLVAELPEKYTKFDVTSDKLYSLTDETVAFAEELQEDVKIYVLVSEDSKDTVLHSTLEKIAALSDHISVEYKDPVKTPTFYREYTSDESIMMNSLIVESDKRYRVVNYSDIYEYTIDYTTYSQSVSGYDGEGQVISAIDYVTRDEMPKAYMITGHDELALDTSFADSIEKQNITIEELSLLTAEKIPEDTEFLIISAPGTDYSKEDAKKVIDYIEKGGQIFVTTSLAESIAEVQPNFQTILDCFNTQVAEGLIVENDANYYYGDPTYLLPEVMNTFLTTGVYGEKYIFAPYAQGIRTTEDDDTTVVSILQTSPEAYSKTNISQATSYDKEEGDIDGPFDIGVYVKKNYGENVAGMFLFTSSNIFTDSADSMVANANLTIFNNCVEEFIDSEEEGVVIPVKTFLAESLVISAGTGMFIGLLMAVMIPLVLLIIGFMIWYQRRKA